VPPGSGAVTPEPGPTAQRPACRTGSGATTRPTGSGNAPATVPPTTARRHPAEGYDEIDRAATVHLVGDVDTVSGPSGSAGSRRKSPAACGCGQPGKSRSCHCFGRGTPEAPSLPPSRQPFEALVPVHAAATTPGPEHPVPNSVTTPVAIHLRSPTAAYRSHPPTSRFVAVLGAVAGPALVLLPARLTWRA
jgi:hypothetical protein